MSERRTDNQAQRTTSGARAARRRSRQERMA